MSHFPKPFYRSARQWWFVEINGKLVPLTEVRQIPNGAIINALHGTLVLITAAGGNGPANVPQAARAKRKKPKVKVSNGFEYTVPPRGEKKGQPPTVSVGPAPEARREINCPRCGQPSPRGLCEACEDALSQLRQLTVAFLDE